MDKPTILMDLPSVQIDLMANPGPDGRVTYYRPIIIEEYRVAVLSARVEPTPMTIPGSILSIIGSRLEKVDFFARLMPFRQPCRLILRQGNPPVLELHPPRTTRPDYRLGTMAARNFEPAPLWKYLLEPHELLPDQETSTPDEQYYLVIRHNDDFVDYEPE